MKVYLHTLTPLHIGTGEKRLPVEYIIYGKNYYPFSETSFIRYINTLQDVNKRTEILEKFIEWIEGVSMEMINIENNMEEMKIQLKNINHKLKQGRIDLHQKQLLETQKREIEQKNRNQNQVLGNLRESFDLMQFANRNGIGKQFTQHIVDNNQNAFSIWGAISRKKEMNVLAGQFSTNPNQNNIAGSTLKGAIRTALIFSVLMNNEYLKDKCLMNIENVVADCLQKLSRTTNDKEIKGIKKKFDNQLGDIIEDVCYCGKNTHEHQDEKFSILKFLQITDARFHSNENKDKIEKLACQTGIFVVKKDGEAYRTQIQIQTPCLEVWSESLRWNFDINTNLSALLEICTKPQKEWDGIEEKMELFYGIASHELKELSELSNGEKQKKIAFLQAKAETHVLKQIQFFYTKALDKEKDWITFQIKRNPANDYSQKYYDSLIQTYDNNQWSKFTLLRAGFAAGFVAHTEYLFMLDNGKELMSNIMKILDIGNAKNNRSEYSPNPLKFPKSRIFLIDNISKVKPLGWSWILTERELADFDKIINEPEKQAAKTQKYSEILLENVTINTELMAEVINSETREVRLLIQGNEFILAMNVTKLYRNIVFENGQIVKVTCKQMTNNRITQVSYTQ